MIFSWIVAVIMYILLLLPVWWPEVQVYKAGKMIKDINPMYTWADWWSNIGVIALLWLALDKLEDIAGKIYDWLRK